MARLVVVGGGRMGEALVGGLIRARWAAAGELWVVEKEPGRAGALAEMHPGLRVVDEITAVAPPIHGAVIAVKPSDVRGVVRALGSHGVDRVLSIAAGITLGSIESALPAKTPVIRAMPNTPALVGEGAAAIAPGSHAREPDLAWAEGILAAVGVVVRVSEAMLDAVTGLSGSGPAYVFLVAEAMTEAGVVAGLPRDVSEKLTIQTLLGASRMLAETGDPAPTLRANVTSPGGTTAAGLKVLEAAGLRAAFLDAVQEATARSRQLGGP